MATPFLSEITMFGCNFAPQGWANCDGGLVPIAQNTALFSLLNTMYGGDGQTTFALPDLRGRFPIHVGQGAGLPATPPQGGKGGAYQVTLSTSQMPAHTHTATVTNVPKSNNVAPNAVNPVGNALAQAEAYTSDMTGASLPTVTNASAGGGMPVNIYNPYQVVRFCISMQGIYPSPT